MMNSKDFSKKKKKTNRPLCDFCYSQTQQHKTRAPTYSAIIDNNPRHPSNETNNQRSYYAKKTNTSAQKLSGTRPHALLKGGREREQIIHKCFFPISLSGYIYMTKVHHSPLLWYVIRPNKHVSSMILMPTNFTIAR